MGREKPLPTSHRSNDEDPNEGSDHGVGRREQNNDKHQVHEMPKKQCGNQ